MGRRGIVTGGLVLGLALLGRLWSAGYLDRVAVRDYPAAGRAAPASVLFLSGDSGMRGLGSVVVRRLAEAGFATTAISTSTVFRLGVDRAMLDGIVARAIGRAERTANGGRLIVVGQSYGADILQTGLADLPRALRPGIARIVLIVPGQGTYYRADPTGLSYYLTPDSRSIATASTLHWAPLSCIYGRADTDDLCTSLALPGATIIGLPGNHYLDHDGARLAATVLREVRRTVVGR